jgi:hypothetical protein
MLLGTLAIAGRFDVQARKQKLRWMPFHKNPTRTELATALAL